MRPICHLLTAVIAALPLAGVSAPAEQRPNVIFIIVDDFGELGCYGSKEIKTPHIPHCLWQRLARFIRELWASVAW